MKPHYILRIFIQTNQRVPWRNTSAHYKNELVIGASGNIIDFCGDAPVKEFDSERSALAYVSDNELRFERLYGPVKFSTCRQSLPVTASL